MSKHVGEKCEKLLRTKFHVIVGRIKLHILGKIELELAEIQLGLFLIQFHLRRIPFKISRFLPVLIKRLDNQEILPFNRMLYQISFQNLHLQDLLHVLFICSIMSVVWKKSLPPAEN